MGHEPDDQRRSRVLVMRSLALLLLLAIPAIADAQNVARSATATSSRTPCAATEGPEKAINGSVSGGWSDKWCVQQGAGAQLTLTWPSPQTARRVVVKHAQAGQEAASWNTRDFLIEARVNGEWATYDDVRGNTAAETTHAIAAGADAIRLTVITPTNDGSAATRIYEVELWESSDPLPPLPPVLFNRTVSWDLPTERTDGTPLTNLRAVRIFWDREGSDDDFAEILVPGTSYVVAGLGLGTWCFTAEAVDMDGLTSDRTTPVCVTNSVDPLPSEPGDFTATPVV